MEKIYLGIDPGNSGAFALLFPGKEEVYDFEDGDTLNYLQMLSAAPRIQPVEALMERVGAMPKQGVSSTFKFATNFGRWIGRLEALDISFGFVIPRKWQGHMFGSTPKIFMIRKGIKKLNTKAMSLEVARGLFPKCRDQLTRKKDADRADALLIAEYCRRLDKGARI